MFKASGIQVAVALALLMSMSAPALADSEVCGDAVGECSRSKGGDVPKPDFTRTQSGEEQPEGEEPEQPEARVR